MINAKTNQMNQYSFVPSIVDVIIDNTQPFSIFLFGSCARQCIRHNSDIDVCIVLDKPISKSEKINTRVLLLDKILDITDYDVDLFICGKDEWLAKHSDPGTFIGKIFKEGRQLYGRQ